MEVLDRTDMRYCSNWDTVLHQDIRKKTLGHSFKISKIN